MVVKADNQPRPCAARRRQAMSQVFESSDVDLIEHVLSSTYAKMRIDAHGRRGGLRMTRNVLGPSVQLDHHEWTLTFDITTGTPLGVLAIGALRSGQASHGSDGSERRYGSGDVFLALQPEHSYVASTVNADINVAILDPALLSQIADTAPGRAQQPVRFTGYEPISAQAAQTWKATSAYIRATMLASPEAATAPLVTSNTVRLLVAVALATFPSNALADPTIEDRHDAHPDTLRRAVAFVDEHAHQDITVADIAAAAFVTTRAVQLAFRRHLDTTPMEYLRRVRLDHARHDLLAADPADQTVTAVAYRWGFANPSRFAALYRQAYGVAPGHTLRQD
jgi:AraC-like DNA-binding protein